MNWSTTIRRAHRWLGIAFTAIVVINIVAMSMGQAIAWLYMLPLLPLFLMMASGLYLFALPYLGHGARRTEG